jgi:transitional endoplasmic reticulum ATPase
MELLRELLGEERFNKLISQATETKKLILEGRIDVAVASRLCNCPTCILALMWATHVARAGSEAARDPFCMWHSCVSFRASESKEKPLPSRGCPCDFCFEWERHGLPYRKEDFDWGRTEKEKAIQVFVAKMRNQPEEPEGQYTLRSLSEIIAEKKQATQKQLTAPQETEEDMTMKKISELIDSRKPVDISGKESPKFETAGTKITIPVGMSFLEGAEWLLKQEREMERNVDVNETIDGFPLDGAMALYKALNKEFGWTETVGTPTWFGEIPPSTISVEVGVNQFAQVPWGKISMPGLEGGYIEPCAGHPNSDGTPVLTIHGVVKKKFRQQIADVVQSARDILRTESIYKGKAIKVTFPEDDVDHGDAISTQDMPTFYDTSRIAPEEVVFSKSVEEQIRVSLFTPITKSQACRDLKIPLKRTALISGPYGVGKTLTAAVTAQLAPKHGWTFILIESAEDLARAVEFSKQYEPAVIFAEDIDSVVQGERSVDMNDILNTIDGVESKGRELIIVLTTNHPEKINKAMLRPGRIDAFIEVLPPDAEAAERLVKVYARDLLADGEDLTEVGKMLSGHKPASIREVVEKAKLASVANSEGTPEKITAKDLETAALVMKPHFALMDEKPVLKEATLDSTFRQLVQEATGKSNGHAVRS